MKTVKIEIYKFVPFERLLHKKLKSKRFREGYFKESVRLLRLQLSHELKAFRIKKRMTQKQVAEKSGMPQSVIARVESGTHSYSLSTLCQIAGVFGKKIGFKEV